MVVLVIGGAAAAPPSVCPASVAAVVHAVVVTGNQRADSSISCKVAFVLLTSDCNFCVLATKSWAACFGTRDFLSVSGNMLLLVENCVLEQFGSFLCSKAERQEGKVSLPRPLSPFCLATES